MKTLTKKYTKSSLKALMPLYYQHALYLASAIKTIAEEYGILTKFFLKNINAWEQVATCHEVAINSWAEKDILATHQNRFGKEKEYTCHPKAKRVGRDLRVRVIWNLLEHILKNERIYSKLSLLELSKSHDILCPLCNQAMWIAEVDYYPIGIHADGTKNYREDITYSFEYGGHEEHILCEEALSGWEFNYNVIQEHYDTSEDELVRESGLVWALCPDDPNHLSLKNTLLVDLWDYGQFLQKKYNSIVKHDDCYCNKCNE